MITYQSKNSWQRPLVIALVASAVVGTGIWWFSGHSGADTTTPVSTAAPVESSTSTMTTMASNNSVPQPVSADPTAMSNGRPADIAPGVWAALDKAVQSKPELKSEADKVVSYMRYQQQFERWQAMEDARDQQQRHQLAQKILDELPDRVARGEFSTSESLMMATVLMSDLEADEHKRERMLDDWGKKMVQTVPQPTDDAQVMVQQKRVEDLRLLPGTILTEGPNPDPAVVQKALEERSRISR